VGGLVIPAGALAARERMTTTPSSELSSHPATHEVDLTEVRQMTQENAGYMVAGG
jgi:hypothetical protein